jgi:ribonucleoside-diphosphate reductase alpha chain
VTTSTQGPRPRTEDLFGFTRTITTGDGKLYATLNYDEFGMREVFLNIGRSGGTTHSFGEALGRMVTLALQNGVDPDAIASNLVGIRSSDPSGFGASRVLSIADGVGQLLKNAPRSLKELYAPEAPLHGRGGAHGSGYVHIQQLPPVEVTVGAAQTQDERTYRVQVLGESPDCPDCGKALRFEEGCKKCPDSVCGYSACS